LYHEARSLSELGFGDHIGPPPRAARPAATILWCCNATAGERPRDGAAGAGAANVHVEGR